MLVCVIFVHVPAVKVSVQSPGVDVGLIPPLLVFFFFRLDIANFLLFGRLSASVGRLWDPGPAYSIFVSNVLFFLFPFSLGLLISRVLRLLGSPSEVIPCTFLVWRFPLIFSSFFSHCFFLIDSLSRDRRLDPVPAFPLRVSPLPMAWREVISLSFSPLSFPW